ncbi:MAG: hypothetical protein U9R72_04745 [Chloroflexota bacterium]|nr:hypothetical protein [Chloroflexota bacterium]
MLREFLPRLSTRRLATAVLFIAVFAMAVRAPADTDTWWHLQAGRVTLEQGRILQTDLFSHTRYGSPWVNHSWLSQVILYELFDRFSYAGLGVWMGLVVTAAFAFVYMQMEGGVFTRGFILVLAAATSAVIWSARPQLFSFLLTAAVAYVLYLFKWKQINRLWILPPLFALWVNLHAGYALGFMVLAAFVAGEILNHLLASFLPTDDPAVSWRGIGLVVGITALSFLLLVVNPNTTRMWTYYLETVQIDVLQEFIQEWSSPDFHPLHTQPFIWLLLTTMAAMGLSDRRVDGTDLALVSGFAYAGLLAGRNFGPFALVAAPALSRHVTAIGARFHQGRKRHRQRATPLQAVINWSLLILLVGLAAVKAYRPLQPAFNEALHRESLPVGAVEWIEEHEPAGQMFNHYNWGGYLIWRLWPEYGVFVDGRTDLYGDTLLRRYLRVQAARPGFEETLAEYDVNLVLTPSESTLSSQLACERGWREMYRDDVASVWVRTEQR